jgi:hypothetical protein
MTTSAPGGVPLLLGRTDHGSRRAGEALLGDQQSAGAEGGDDGVLPEHSGRDITL